MKKKFSDLEIGGKFECWADLVLGYEYPRICQCIKTTESRAKTFAGKEYLVNVAEDVWILE